MPHNVITKVKGIIKTEESASYAMAGSIVEVGLKLPVDFDKEFLRRGNVLCDPQYPIKLV